MMEKMARFRSLLDPPRDLPDQCRAGGHEYALLRAGILDPWGSVSLYTLNQWNVQKDAR